MVKFKFKKSSRVVKAWVTMVLAGSYTVDEVPRLGNLPEVVQEVLDELVNTKDDKTNGKSDDKTDGKSDGKVDSDKSENGSDDEVVV